MTAEKIAGNEQKLKFINLFEKNKCGEKIITAIMKRIIKFNTYVCTLKCLSYGGEIFFEKMAGKIRDYRENLKIKMKKISGNQRNDGKKSKILQTKKWWKNSKKKNVKLKKNGKIVGKIKTNKIAWKMVKSTITKTGKNFKPSENNLNS